MGSGFQTFVAGAVLTASEVNNYLMEQSVMSFTNSTARASAVTAPETGQVYWDQALFTLNVYNGTSWVCISPQAAYAAGAFALSTNTTYAAHTGAAVSVLTGTKALVTVSCAIVTPNTNTVYHGFAVSGATTVAASDAKATAFTGAFGGSGTFYVTGLTAGTNTFTTQERCTANNYFIQDRYISVVGIP